MYSTESIQIKRNQGVDKDAVLTLLQAIAVVTSGLASYGYPVHCLTTEIAG